MCHASWGAGGRRSRIFWSSIMTVLRACVLFFFQAEDGIRDLTVTGVQTCALPISRSASLHQRRAVDAALRWCNDADRARPSQTQAGSVGAGLEFTPGAIIYRGQQIGRASCRGRVEISGVAGSLKKKQ